MYLPFKPDPARLREAERARRNRLEIVKARSIGEVTRRDLIRWGAFTATGLLACKNGLSPFASSAYGQVPTGTPRSPLFGVAKFTQKLQRAEWVKPITMTRGTLANADKAYWGSGYESEFAAKRMSYHNDYSAVAGGDPAFCNPTTKIGPMEGRPPGPAYAHQRWSDFVPRVGYCMSWAPCAAGTRFHPGMPDQQANSIWTYGVGRNARGSLPPFLIKARYGEPILMRVYNNTPVSRTDNNGFGRNETQLHFHNAHNGAESDGATGAHHLPGTFYDYLWSTALARRDRINTGATDARASGPDDGTGLVRVPGDFREIQGTLWAHDHRSFFTAENVYKGNIGLVNMYSGPDRGNEALNDGVNLRLPSGTHLPWGNTDFDVNLVVSDCATDRDGQLFFDVFDTDGFLGDLPLVNFQYAPFMEVLPRKYRFRILNACQARFVRLVVAGANNAAMPVTFIANDGNLMVNPITVSQLDEQATGERYDIVVDFSKSRVGDRLHLVNVLRQTDGRKPDKTLSLSDAFKGKSEDPLVGPILQFRVVSSVPSVDMPGKTNYATTPDVSRVPAVLTEQVPVVAPVRQRFIEFKRGDGDSRRTETGECNPDCAETAQSFPWVVRINGESTHSFNANRISMLIPRPGEVEHWTYINGGGGWDHPIHLHFEEGVTIDRGGASIPATERLARKDVWRLRPGGRVKFQVEFGEFGGSYVSHCHNTVHEDFAMLIRFQVLSQRAGQEAQSLVTMTPVPTPEGIKWMRPEILREGIPSDFRQASLGINP